MPSLPAVDWSIPVLSQSPDPSFWMITYRCPVRPTFSPPSLLLYSRFEHWDVVDGCPARDKCAPPRSMFARDGKNIMLTMPVPRLDIFSSGRNRRRRIFRGFRQLIAAGVWEVWAGVAGLMLHSCLCVDGRPFKKRVSKLRFKLFRCESTSLAR